MEKIKEVASKFKFDGDYLSCAPHGDGHINDTFVVNFENGTHKRYILQKINTSIFKKPEELMHNVTLITDFLGKKIISFGGDPKRETLTIIRTKDNENHFTDTDGSFWRAYVFIEGTKTYPIVEKPSHFYQSGKAFGKFQKMLSDFDATLLYETIPNFHNTAKRIEDFKLAIEENKSGRKNEVEEEIAYALAQQDEAITLCNMILNKQLPIRVTHNDTKFNNILIDEKTDLAICVVDLDTVMPGLSLYDFGDSIRSGTNNALEDEIDLTKVTFNIDLFEMFTKGFLEETGDILTDNEKENLALSAKIITYEIGIRFLSDHLNGDVYFKIHRDGHNLDRARNQFKLHSEMGKNFDSMKEIVKKYCN